MCTIGLAAGFKKRYFGRALKTSVARQVHKISPRRLRPFVSFVRRVHTPVDVRIKSTTVCNRDSIADRLENFTIDRKKKRRFGQ